jgi:7-cyano-7-deazaguanine synthase
MKQQELDLKPSSSSAVVVLSGGQDSVTCLGLALKKHTKVYGLGFSYGQTHSVELEQAKLICEGFDVPFEIFTIPALKELGDSALTTGGDVSAAHHRNKTLPASFVPNRNALFLTTAHAYAQKVEASTIYTGVCQTDYSGYPDCRLAFIVALQNALNIGYLTDIQIETPLMNLTKAETFDLADEVGILQVVLEHSHTCYNGVRNIKHEWGAGCGKCPACNLRRKGYHEFVVSRDTDGYLVGSNEEESE